MDLVMITETFGVKTVIVVAIAILIVFFIQRKRIADIIWDYVLSLEDEFESFVGDELQEQESQTREWMYHLYDSIPANLRMFISRKTYEKLVDLSFGKLHDYLFGDKDE
jgi:hypothetical protein